MAKNSIAILGLGRYGCSLATTMYEMGEDVLVVDKDEMVIRDMSSKVTMAVCANLDNEDEVMALGLQNMDIVITCMGSNLSASILCISIAKEKNVPVVIAKASTDRMKKILKRVGADKIICPEEEGGIRSARILTSKYIHDFFEIDENLCMIEIQPRKEWIGHDLVELDLRRKYNMNVAAMKKKGGKWTYVDPNRKIKEDTLLMAIIEIDKISQWK
ncbi:potassium channel family protein [Butyrivibrio sp. MC2013]|uniref:potassium channel family protein n=1 Tax=Butyrivibrio sp. MC2013 TaxID=1280686 RepID=UPI0003F59006|nr:TrkA family potassium uptake protein [Butyrivibrio sp. MC2013]